MKKLLFTALPVVAMLIAPPTVLAVFTVGQGGTGQTSFLTGACLLGNGTNPLNATYSPSFASINATSTTATSTFSSNIVINGRFEIGSIFSYAEFEGITVKTDFRLPAFLGSIQFTDLANTESFAVLTAEELGRLSIFGAGTGIAVLDVNSLSGGETIFTFPNYNGTFGLLEANQIWSGNNTFSKGASATTTVTFGGLGDSTSKSCFNTKNTSGDDISFYFVGTTMVVENNVCR